MFFDIHDFFPYSFSFRFIFFSLGMIHIFILSLISNAIKKVSLISFTSQKHESAALMD